MGEPEVVGGPDLGFGGLNLAAAENGRAAGIKFKKDATGEMTQEELDASGLEEWPLHYAIADALGGMVKPFDQYQGPYILVGSEVRGRGVYAPATPMKGTVRLWIQADEGGLARVYNEENDKLSEEFPWDDTEQAIEAAKSVLRTEEGKMAANSKVAFRAPGDKRVRTDSGLMGWKNNLQSGYENFEEFKSYSDTYGIAERLGFGSAEEAWEANPVVQGSVEPSDFRVSGASRKKVAVTPPGISEDTMHELKDEYPGEPDKAYATAWKIHNEKKGGGNEGSWFVNNQDTGEVKEDGGRTPEVGEAHRLVDEGPAKLDRPETELPITLNSSKQAGQWSSEVLGESSSTIKVLTKQLDNLYAAHQEGRLDSAAFQAEFDIATAARNAAKRQWATKKNIELGREANPKTAADGMTASKALKKAESIAEKLKGMYLDAKEITEANDSRPVREAVEAIYRAYDMLGLAAKVLGKQQMQEDAEAEAIKVKEKGKKKGSLLDSLVLAAAE